MKKKNISLCTAASNHEEFLINLFLECHPELDLIANINEEQKCSIILRQFAAEEQQLLSFYPRAELNIVMLDNRPIGKLYLSHSTKTVRIVDIGILKEFRGAGIGREIVSLVIEWASNHHKTVTLQVAWFNQGAYAFYKKLGFQVIEEKGPFYEMKYMP